MSYTNGLDKPSDYFVTKLYTGNGGTQSITGVGFAPNWVWGKSRSLTEGNAVHDTVRGVRKNILTNTTAAEEDIASITAFGSDGFTLGSNAHLNANNSSMVAWNWKAGGSASSNSNGTITSSVSANTDAGFSIVSYTGNGSDNATIGHGLGSSIDFVIVKRRNTTSNWLVQGSKVGTGYGQYLELNATNAIASASDNIKSVSSSLLTLGTNGSCNGSSDTYIAYCFAEKQGYSKFGSYTGNGNADGTFVFCGFKPACIIIKGAVSGAGDAAQNWEIYDNKRLGYNVDNNNLNPNTSGAESTGDRLDIVSNGFKIRVNSDGVNDNGSTYIYMAFAENPFVTSTGVPATAR